MLHSKLWWCPLSSKVFTVIVQRLTLGNWHLPPPEAPHPHDYFSNSASCSQKIYNSHYPTDLPDAWSNIFWMKLICTANHSQWCIPAASCLQRKRRKWGGGGWRGEHSSSPLFLLSLPACAFYHPGQQHMYLSIFSLIVFNYSKWFRFRSSSLHQLLMDYVSSLFVCLRDTFNAFLLKCLHRSS